MPDSPPLSQRLQADLSEARRRADDAGAMVRTIELAVGLATNLEAVTAERDRLQRLVGALGGEPDADPEGAPNTPGD